MVVLNQPTCMVAVVLKQSACMILVGIQLSLSPPDVNLSIPEYVLFQSRKEEAGGCLGACSIGSNSGKISYMH